MADAFQALDRRSLAHDAAEHLKELIASGALQPGDKLPPERALATRLGVSRPTLREAVRGAVEESGRQTLHRLQLALDGLRLLRASGDTSSYGRPGMLQRAVSNLVENAIRYNHPGGFVRIMLSKTDHLAVLQVENSGEVVAVAAVPHLFDPRSC